MDQINPSQIFPSFGRDNDTLVRNQYIEVLTGLHNDTVMAPDEQWYRVRTFGSQLWPDIQYDGWQIDWDSPFDNSGAMNYWNHLAAPYPPP